MDDPKKLLQDANGYLRTAQNNMFSGKNAEAVELINKADEFGLLAKQQIPDDFQVTSLFQKIEKMRKDLERKGIATRPGGNTELPFEVQSQLRSIRDYVISKDLEGARRELNGYYSRFAGPMTNIPEIVEIKQELEKLEIEAKRQAEKHAEEKRANADSKQVLDEMCRNWELKIRALPYFDGTPRNIPGLLFEQENFKKAQELLGEYQQMNFPGQKSISLESQVQEFGYRVQMFPSNFANTAISLAAEITSLIEERMTTLNNDKAWMSDPAQLPYFVGKNELDRFQEQIEEIRPLFNDNPWELESVTNALGSLSTMNEQRKVERSKRISMKPEVISGAEAEAPIAAATQTVSRYYPGAKVLKAALVKPWESKRVEEWADNTKTQWVVKNLNETTVQIAALLTDGTCKLFTLNVNKQLLNDGTFGQAQSHILFDELVERSNFE